MEKSVDKPVEKTTEELFEEKIKVVLNLIRPNNTATDAQSGSGAAQSPDPPHTREQPSPVQRPVMQSLASSHASPMSPAPAEVSQTPSNTFVIGLPWAFGSGQMDATLDATRLRRELGMIFPGKTSRT